MPKANVIGLACNRAEDDNNTLSCMPPDRTIQNHSRIGTPAVNEGVFSPSRGNISIFAKWTGNIDPLDTYVHGYTTQERNSNFLCIEKVGVKSIPDKIVADLDPSIRVNFANSVLGESHKFKNFGLPTFDEMGIHNIDFSPSTIAKILNGIQGDNFRNNRLGYKHDFERVSELETREAFEQETENIPQTRQMDLVTT